MTRHTHWYAMIGPDRREIGCALLDVEHGPDGSLYARWELKLDIPGRAVEEERSMTLDPELRVVTAGYRSDHNLIQLRRDGQQLVGERTAHGHGESSSVTIDAGDDAITALGFVLACVMPREPGTEWVRQRVNEAEGGRDLGAQVLRVVGAESLDLPGGAVEATRIDVLRADHHPFHVWLDADGVILQTAGGGLTMQIRAEDTSHLFSGRGPVLEMVGGDDKSILVLEGELADRVPDDVFAHLTEPERITLWWADEVAVDPHVGGRYHLTWRDAGWTLRGEITHFEAGRVLGFTWAWTHEPDLGLTARVELLPLVHGTRLRVVLEPYEGDVTRFRHGHAFVWRTAADQLRTHFEETCHEAR